MKPYQVKLRIVGVLSLILAVLAAWLPLPSRAALAGDWKDYINFDSTYGYILRSYNKSKADYDQITEITITNEGPTGNYVMIAPAAGENGFFDASSVIEKITFECVSANQIAITETALTNMFRNCIGLQEVTFVPGSNSAVVSTSVPQEAESMFEGDVALLRADLTGLYDFKPANVKRMFYGCTALEEIDLSTADFSNITTENAKDMFAGCDALQTIHTPVNIRGETTPGAGDAVEIPLPADASGSNRFKPEGTVRTYYTNLPTRDSVAENTSVTLVRSYDVDTLEVNSEKIDLDDLEVGDTRTLTVRITPLNATTRTVMLNTSDNGIIKFIGSGASFDGGTATVTVNSDGTALVQVEAVALGTVTITATAPIDSSLPHTLSGNSISASADIKVVIERIPVQSLDVSDTEVQVTIGTPVTVTASVMPGNTTGPEVTWASGNTDIATVSGEAATVGTATEPATSVATIKGEKPGTTHITVTSNGDPSKTKVIQVRVVSPYELKTSYTSGSSTEYTDKRTDTTNGSATVVTSDEKPYKGDLYLHVTSETEATTPKNSTFPAQLGKATTITADKYVSYFKLAIDDRNTGDGTVPEDADELGMVTVTMALPGNQAYTGTLPQVYAYDAATGATKALTVTSEAADVGNNGTIRAVRFTVNSASLAPEYALVMDAAPTTRTYELGARDVRSDKTTPAIAHAAQDTSGAKVTHQESDIYLHVEESVNNTWKDYVYQAFPDYKPYFMDLHLSEKRDSEVAISYEYNKVRVYLSMPSGVTLTDKVLLIREDHAQSTATSPKHEVVTYNYAEGLNNGYQYMAFDAGKENFSEYTILVPLGDASGTTSGSTVFSSEGIVINVNIPSINITIDANGSIISGGGGTNSGSSGTQQSGQQQQQQQQASPAGTTIINYNYYGGTIPGNAGDMPTTGGAHMYRILIVILLALSGLVEVMLSIPTKRRLHST